MEKIASTKNDSELEKLMVVKLVLSNVIYGIEHNQNINEIMEKLFEGKNTLSQAHDWVVDTLRLLMRDGVIILDLSNDEIEWQKGWDDLINQYTTKGEEQ